MAKETGFANFTPAEAEDFKEGQQQHPVQEPYAGKEQSHKRKQDHQTKIEVDELK